MVDISDWLRPVDRSVRLDGQTRTVSMRRHYDTTPEDVWDAWTKPERVGRWLGELTGDVREGGEVFLQMEPESHATCRIVRCDPPHRLVATWSYPDEPETAAELRLSKDGDRTLLRLEHVGFTQKEHSRNYGEGWEDFLHRLDQYVRGNDPSALAWKDVQAVLDPFWTPLVENPTSGQRLPTVSIDGESATLEAHWSYPASPEEVWAAFTDPARLARWFADVTLDDNEWTATFDQGKATGHIEQCEPARELSTSWLWDHEDKPSQLRISLESTADGTILRLTETSVPTKSATGYAAGWHAYLSGLAAHLIGKDPADADWYAAFTLARKAIS